MAREKASGFAVTLMDLEGFCNLATNIHSGFSDVIGS